eukprot:TRINITY_DN10_c0_g2_i1.p1 TRINITY_DN10_c0_g2~~TRINITY_DN10_c0_g2_i1.p1  ORF type:complete len:423 (-),score=134.19 TRINITY_DN10_c0_g2_i1:641-1909(-)
MDEEELSNSVWSTIQDNSPILSLENICIELIASSPYIIDLIPSFQFLPNNIIQTIARQALNKGSINDNNIHKFIFEEQQEQQELIINNYSFNNLNDNSSIKLCGLSSVNVSQRVLLPLLCSLKFLYELDLNRCNVIGEHGFIQLFESNALKNIKILKLSRSIELTDKALITLASNILDPGLLILDISRCIQITDIGVIAILKKSPNIEQLELYTNKQLTAKSIDQLSENCQNLKRINIGRTSLESNSVSNLLSKAIELHALIISNCKWLTSSVIAAIATKNLIFLDLSGANHIPFQKLGEALQLSMNPYGFTTIYFSGCNQIIDPIIKIVALNSPNLKSLYLSNCSAITDTSLEYISFCTELQVLNLCLCRNLTIDALCKTLVKLPNLKTLYLSRCQRIESKLFTILSLYCKKITNVGSCKL